MREFFKQTYKGFYCSICDYENHKYFDQENNKIQYSEKFCRDIVENALQSTILFHIDIVKLMNMILKMTTSCDYQGEFNSAAKFPKELTFFQIEENMQQLKTCRDNRNKKDWFAYCKDVCNNFSTGLYSEFFEPNIKLIYNFNIYMKDILAKRKQELALKLAAGKRRLEEAKPEEEAGEEKPENPFETRLKTVYKPGLGGKLDISTWESDFQVDGISLYDDGLNSLITESMYNQIKTYLQLEKKDSNL